MRFLKKAIQAKDNRVREVFPNGIHVIETMNIGESHVSVQIKSFASIAAYNFALDVTTPSPMASAGRNDGRAIHEVNKNIPLSELMLDESIVDPFEQIKDAVYVYLLASDDIYKDATLEVL